jgi:hypothetical protein
MPVLITLHLALHAKIVNNGEQKEGAEGLPCRAQFDKVTKEFGLPQIPPKASGKPPVTGMPSGRLAAEFCVRSARSQVASRKIAAHATERLHGAALGEISTPKFARGR